MMHDPIRMVFINIILVFLVGASLLIYYYIYPKKKVNLVFLLILLSLLPLVSVLRAGSYESGDLTINVFKSMSFYENLTQGNIVPQWAGELNGTFGYPLFIFIYPLPYYAIALLHFFGIGFLVSIKIYIALCFIASGIAMYLWVKEEIGKVSAFVAALFYLYAPYHLVDIHFRISLAEIAAFALLPFLLFSTKKFFDKKHLLFSITITLFVFLILISNQAIALIGLPLIYLYGFFVWKLLKKKTKKVFFHYTLSFIFGALLSSYFWLPVILESVYTHQALYAQVIDYVMIQELLYSPWRYGLLFQGPQGELSFILGYVQLAVLLLIIVFLQRNKFSITEKKKILISLVIVFLLSFLMLPQASFIWDGIPILRNFQFTYRLLLIIAIPLSLLAGFLVLKLPKKWILLLCVLVMLQTILNWGNRKTLPDVTDAFLKKEFIYSSRVEGFQPAVPKWVDPQNPWVKTPPKQHIEIIRGNANIIPIERTNIKHEYVANVTSDTQFKENTLYFPGWTILANNKPVAIDFQNKKHQGAMFFTLPKGVYKIEVIFGDTKVRQSAKIVSFVSLLLFLGYCTFYRRIKV